MNLKLYLRIFRRFWAVVAIGFALAILLAFTAMAKVSFAHGFSVSYRQQATWQGSTRLFVTQRGFPWGRSTFPVTPATAGGTTGSPSDSGSQFADPSRLAGLAVIYVQLMNGDLIKRQMRPDASQGAFVGATVVTDPSTQGPLPLLDVAGQAPTPAKAVRVSDAAATHFRSYIAAGATALQSRTGIHISRPPLPVTGSKFAS